MRNERGGKRQVTGSEGGVRREKVRGMMGDEGRRRWEGKEGRAFPFCLLPSSLLIGLPPFLPSSPTFFPPSLSLLLPRSFLSPASLLSRSSLLLPFRFPILTRTRAEGGVMEEGLSLMASPSFPMPSLISSLLPALFSIPSFFPRSSPDSLLTSSCPPTFSSFLTPLSSNLLSPCSSLAPSSLLPPL